MNHYYTVIHAVYVMLLGFLQSNDYLASLYTRLRT